MKKVAQLWKSYVRDRGEGALIVHDLTTDGRRPSAIWEAFWVPGARCQVTGVRCHETGSGGGRDRGRIEKLTLFD